MSEGIFTKEQAEAATTAASLNAFIEFQHAMCEHPEGPDACDHCACMDGERVDG